MFKLFALFCLLFFIAARLDAQTNKPDDYEKMKAEYEADRNHFDSLLMAGVTEKFGSDTNVMVVITDAMWFTYGCFISGTGRNYTVTSFNYEKHRYNFIQTAKINLQKCPALAPGALEVALRDSCPLMLDGPSDEKGLNLILMKNGQKLVEFETSYSSLQECSQKHLMKIFDALECFIYCGSPFNKGKCKVIYK